jgi:hypothetical protein
MIRAAVAIADDELDEEVEREGRGELGRAGWEEGGREGEGRMS